MTDDASQCVPTVRMAHLGLGAFHRAHQAWYTQQANEDADSSSPWGYESFSGRSPKVAAALAQQGCRYHLVIRGPDGDQVQEISSIARATDGAARARMRRVLGADSTALISVTVTEAGYHLDERGELDTTSPGVQGDLEAMASHTPKSLTTPVGRLVEGLRERRSRGASPIAIVSCDNLSANGRILERTVRSFSEGVDPSLSSWIDDHVSFVSTMVDRITPAVDPETLAIELPSYDRMPVVAEPYTEWILAGDFPAGRPTWEAGGARFVSDVRPFEERKLWILNAGHSLLAYLGSVRGHTTVAQAMADPVCLRALERLWDEAEPAIRLPSDEVQRARKSVGERWRNPRIEHYLSQIGRDGLQKLRIRLAPILIRWQEEGWGIPRGQLGLLGAWVVAVRAGVTEDTSAPDLVRGTLRDGVLTALALISPGLRGDERVESATLHAAECALSA